MSTSQMAKRRLQMAEERREVKSLRRTWAQGDKAVIESMRTRMPTIEDWIEAKRSEIEHRQAEIDFTSEGATVRAAVLQGQQQIVRELADMMLADKENRDDA